MTPILRRTLSVGLALGAALAVWAAGTLQPKLLDLRRSEGLTQTDPLDDLPPSAVFSTVALGGFRGLLVDFLWMRSSRLQQEGRYFELAQLADWITKLQPRFASIWAYHAWNLAYNVSVAFDDPADRWRWVRQGIRILRDRGLTLNPGSPALYRELAWMFMHKLGANLDRANGYYKQQWAIEMEDALGSGHPDLAPWAAASAPAARWSEQTRLNPVLMLEIEQKYGPLDWRSVHTQAIYWAYAGQKLARRTEERGMFDRLIFQSLSEAFLQGRVWKDAQTGAYLFTPCPDLLPGVRRAYLEALHRHNDDAMRTAHGNFLVDAIMICVAFQQLDTAHELHAELVRRYPDRADPDFETFTSKTYRDFVDRQTPDAAGAAVESAFYQAAFWEAAGDTQQAGGYDHLARLSWKHYMDRRSDPEEKERVGLPDLESIRRSARARALHDRGGVAAKSGDQ